MKSLSLLIALLSLASTLRGEIKPEPKSKKIYDCPYVAKPPYGVLAWAASDRMRNPKTRESRFVDYNSEAAQNLWLDATVERDVAKDDKSSNRATAFSMAYDDRGWYIYIEGEEPLLQELIDSLADPKSAGFKEGYEIFFSPGLHNVPYYQIITKTFGSTPPNFVDWGMPHRHYHSLENFAKFEALALEKSAGTFVFIPWEAIYEYVPLEGADWRFSIVRWMPFGKAGGVTWGGKVHDSGNFGLVRFEPPPPEARQKIENRLLRFAWTKFQAEARAQSTFWSDPKLGDLDFYESILKPEIARQQAAGEALDWKAEGKAAGRELLGDWMEFRYKVSELRNDYLMNKRFSEAR